MQWTEEWNNAICSDIDGSRDGHTEWNKSDRERQIWSDSNYKWNLRKWYKRTYLQKEKESQIEKANRQFLRQKGVCEISWEMGAEIYRLQHTKEITAKNLVCGTGNSLPCDDRCGKGIWKRMDICVCKGHFTVQRKLKQYCNPSTLQ